MSAADLPFRLEPGRPGRDEDDVPATRLGVRTPNAWLDRIATCAARRGLSRHAWLRLAVYRQMEEDDPQGASGCNQDATI